MAPSPIVVIAGSSGFIGSALADAFASDGYEVREIGRAAPVTWDDPAAIVRAVDGADVVVNLAGKSVNCRYTDREPRRDPALPRRDHPRAARCDRRGAASAAGVAQRVDGDDLPALDGPSEHRGGRRDRRGILRGCRDELGARVVRRRPAAHAPSRAAHGDRARRRAGREDAAARSPGSGSADRRSTAGGPEPAAIAASAPHPTGEGRAAWHRTRRASEVQLGAHRRRDRRDPVHPRSTTTSPGRSTWRARTPATTAPSCGAAPRGRHARSGCPPYRWMLEPAMWALRTESELVLKSRWVLPEPLTAAGYTFAQPDLRTALRSLVR